MEILALLLIVGVVLLFVIPTKKFKGSTDHAARAPGCTCTNITRWSMDVDNNCPIHGDWCEPLYPIEEIKAAGEKERAYIKAGREYNKILNDKWNRE